MTQKIVFNYGNITDEHKEAAAECANILDNMNNNETAELIRKQFKIVENPKFDLTGHPIVKAAEESNVFLSVQGFITDNGVDYPIIGITDDVRKIIDLHNKIIENHETK